MGFEPTISAGEDLCLRPHGYWYLAVLMDGRGFGVRMSTFFYFLIMRCERIQWSSFTHTHTHTLTHIVFTIVEGQVIIIY